MKAKPRSRRTEKKPTELVRGEPVVRSVLAATLAELANVGYRGLRIEDVATRAGVNKTTIYRRWPTKEDLVGAAFRSMTGDKLVIPTTGSLRGDLLAIASRMVESASTPEGQSLFRVLMTEGPDSEIMDIVRTQTETDRAVWRAMFEVHSARGEFAPGVDPTILFDVLIAYLHQKLIADRTNLNEVDIGRLIEVLLLGVLHPDKRSTATPKPRARRAKA